MKFIPTLVLIVVFVLPELASAQSFVTCSGTDCSACNIVQMANKVLVWLIAMAFLFFAVLAVIAGFGLVTSGGNSEALSSAKQKFINAFIGLIIILASFLLVDTIMRGLLNGGTGNIQGYGPWAEVQCHTQLASTIVPWAGDPSMPNSGSNVISTTACAASGSSGNIDCSVAEAACAALNKNPEIDTTDPTNYKVNCWDVVVSSPALPSGPPTATCTGSSCVPLGAVPCKNTASCSISSELQPKLLAMHQAAGVAGARVTEAMPPTRVHKSPCHQNGTCVDYGVGGGMAPNDVVKVINAATANGLRPVYEVSTPAQKAAVVAAGAPADSVKVLGSWISAPHFSIYAQ
ncbi:hypothetical protein H6784_05095 [Candidatus Nomurabacteria bacterium]|nr:hypothetical protein [Candidatus Nomurabacteria bacterium]